MKVLSIGFDRAFFDPSSEARRRLLMHGASFKELHVVVFSTKAHNLRTERVAQNIWLYPTNSRSRFFYIRDAIRVASEILRESADFVMSAQDPFESGWVAAYVARRRSVPLQIQIHTDFLAPAFSSSLLNRVRLFIAKRTLPLADTVRVVSKRIADSLLEANIRLKSEPSILPVFVDQANVSSGDSSYLQRKFPSFDFRILMVSRLSFEKNITAALTIFKDVHERHARAGLIIVGDGPLRQKLELKVKQLGLQSAVVFEGWVAPHALRDYYASADLFLQTSLYEGFGRSLFEAALAGLPFVSSDAGIAPEIDEEHICDVFLHDCFVEKIVQAVTAGPGFRNRGEVVKERTRPFLSRDEHVYVSDYKKLLQQTYEKRTC